MGLIKTKEDGDVLRFLKKYISTGSYTVQEKLILLVADAYGIHPSKITLDNFLSIVSELPEQIRQRIDSNMTTFQQSYENARYSWENPILGRERSREIARKARKIERTFKVRITDIIVSQGPKKFVVPILSQSEKTRICVAILIPEANVPKCTQLNKIMKCNYDVIFDGGITSIHFYRLP